MKKIIKEIYPYIIIIVIVIIIRTFIITPVNVDGPSMMNTLLDKDLMILKKYDKNFERNEIIVFKKDNKERLIKRIIGLPNEKIKCVSGTIYINNEKYDDIYASGETKDFPEVTLKEDEYFVMGDNRNNSLDSRIIGPIKKNSIMGSTDLIIFPFNRIKKL